MLWLLHFCICRTCHCYCIANSRHCLQAAEMTAHPMLELLENSEQPLTTRYSRRLITLKKVAPYDASAEQMFRCQQESSR